MDPKDFFRGFFGMPPRHPNNPNFHNPSDDSEEFENDSNQQNHPGFHGSFRVFVNPMEMESQIDAMLKQFGFNGAGPFGSIPGIFGQGSHPGEGFPNRGGLNENSEEENPRDFMLKKDHNPGYLRPDHSTERHDVEIDHLPDDFDKLYKRPEPPESRQSHQTFTKTFNFGHSFSSSSVRLPGQCTIIVCIFSASYLHIHASIT